MGESVRVLNKGAGLETICGSKTHAGRVNITLSHDEKVAQTVDSLDPRTEDPTPKRSARAGVVQSALQ